MASIVLIEDDRLIKKMYQEALEQAGFDVFVALSGKKGLELIKSEEPSLILLDLRLPDMDGSELMKEIKEDSVFGKIPVIVLTNNDDPEDMAKVLKLGAKECIIKIDINPDILVKKVKQTLSSK